MDCLALPIMLQLAGRLWGAERGSCEIGWRCRILLHTAAGPGAECGVHELQAGPGNELLGATDNAADSWTHCDTVVRCGRRR